MDLVGAEPASRLEARGGEGDLDEAVLALLAQGEGAAGDDHEIVALLQRAWEQLSLISMTVATKGSRTEAPDIHLECFDEKRCFAFCYLSEFDPGPWKMSICPHLEFRQLLRPVWVAHPYW